jgi:hypothetical protein
MGLLPFRFNLTQLYLNGFTLDWLISDVSILLLFSNISSQYSLPIESIFDDKSTHSFAYSSCRQNYMHHSPYWLQAYTANTKSLFLHLLRSESCALVRSPSYMHVLPVLLPSRYHASPFSDMNLDVK